MQTSYQYWIDCEKKWQVIKAMKTAKAFHLRPLISQLLFVNAGTPHFQAAVCVSFELISDLWFNQTTYNDYIIEIYDMKINSSFCS